MYVYEHIIASHYGWELDKIRALDTQDFYVHLRICLEREAADKEHQAIMDGAVPSGNSNEQEVGKPKVIAKRKLPSGATVETTKEKSMKFNSSVRKVRVDSQGNYIGEV